ncbi:14997_t:CDS:2 [Funneliformis geosporum]|uniref:14997_t:CDS:1 n=1 Tax=Funneliformis geosporum TaxID=1117311 RepID=A0A9W4STW6_9GLOM|nr:14997_t:CDS:2 [Funneliformis geosporum]
MKHSEYLHSPKTNTYRRRSKSLSDKADNGKNGSLYSKRHHSPPPPMRAHHQPVMKFNADMWMQDFKQNVMEKLFKEERFKAFQKRRKELENVMDVSDDEEWQEQQKITPVIASSQYVLIQSVVQNEWENYQSSPFSQYQLWLQEQQLLYAAQQYQQKQQEFINNLPTEIAQAVIAKNLPPEWFQYRERNDQ